MFLLEKTSKSRKTCPSRFKNLNENSNENNISCYLINTKPENWSNAKKKCESRNAHLISIDTFKEKNYVLEYLLAFHYRFSTNSRDVDSTDVRYEYWTSGSDMTQEGRWIWDRNGRNIVGDAGWLRLRKPESDTENCLSWRLTLITGGSGSEIYSQVKEGWVSSWCLKEFPYICELNL